MRVTHTAAPIREQIVHNLRVAIVQGQFKPGQRLIERELCELLGASRTPIREALRQLETELLIELKPNKGPVVAKVTKKDAEEIYQIRQLLESLACRLFAENASEKDIKRLRKSYEQLHMTIKRNNFKQLLNGKAAILAVMDFKIILINLLLQPSNRIP